MNKDAVYLVYRDIGICPTEMDEIWLGWTENLYVANLRVLMLKRSVKEQGGDISAIKLVPFRNYNEMVQFLLDFDVNIIDNDELFYHRISLYETGTPLSVSRSGVWTGVEVGDAIECVINVIADFNVLIKYADDLIRFAEIIRNPQLANLLVSFANRVRDYAFLFQIRENFDSDVVAVLETNDCSEDFKLVRSAFLESTGLDIVTPDVMEGFRGVFDETEILIRIGGLDPIESEGG